jgi:hypothetical protein
MPSAARIDLQARLDDVHELIKAHGAVTGRRRGRPADGRGAAITRAGVVLLSAAFETFVEELFNEAAELIFTPSKDDLAQLILNTSKRLNNPSVFKVEMLYFNLGMPWALRNVGWKKFSNETMRKELEKLVHTRGSIAHGNGDSVRLQTLRRWLNMIEILLLRLKPKLRATLKSSPVGVQLGSFKIEGGRRSQSAHRYRPLRRAVHWPHWTGAAAIASSWS